jgi:hypothetical protein
MKTAVSVVATLVVLVVLTCALLAQETKPVPKDSMRVTIPGCSRGYAFVAGARTPDEPGSAEIPEGMRLRMNGSKKLMAEIKAREGSMIAITGLIRKGQRPEGVGIGGVRIAPSPSPGGIVGSPVASQIQIDVEGWRPAVGSC